MLNRKKIIIDDKIPFIKGVLEPYFEVEYLAGDRIVSEVVADCVAIISRTRTKINRELLEGSSVELVVTATIGLDHIDMAYCKSAGIEVCSAAGCNARGVASWVLASLAELARRGEITAVEGKTLGIIGVGNVGGELAEMAQRRGYKLLLNDPPRAEKEGSEGFSELDELLKESDIITLHIPLTELTCGMINSKSLALLKQGAVLLSSARGEAIDEESLKGAIRGKGLLYVGDVWCNEPDIDRELMDLSRIATPHIAGYSARGKARASSMSVQSVGRYFGIECLMDWDCSLDYPLEEPERFDVMAYDCKLRSSPGSFESQRIIYNC